MAEDGIATVLAASLEAEDRRAVVDRRAQAVDAADAGDDDHVAPLEQRVGRGVAELVDLLVPARVLLDVRVGPGQVRLGLVVVEVADEVLDRVVREELAELGVELRGERLVVGEHEGRLLVPLDRFGDRERLAGAGRAEQGLVAQSRGPGRRPARSIAWGWSPVGSKSATSLKSGIGRGYTNRPKSNTRSVDARPGPSGRPGASATLPYERAPRSGRIALSGSSGADGMLRPGSRWRVRETTARRPTDVERTSRRWRADSAAGDGRIGRPRPARAWSSSPWRCRSSSS